MAYNASTPDTIIGVTRDEFGDAFAKTIVQHWGGTTVFIPKVPKSENLFLEFVGPERAKFYCHYLGGDSYYIQASRPEANLEAVARLSEEGLRVSEIARRIGISERHTYAIRAQIRAQRLEHGERNA